MTELWDSIVKFYETNGKMMMDGVVRTMDLTLISTGVSFILGLLLALLLYMLSPKGLKPVGWLYRILDIIVNILRSIPFIILLAMLFPLIKGVLPKGKAIGTKGYGFHMALIIAAVPYVARMFESSLLEVNPGVIEAAHSMGCSDSKILFRVVIPEARTSLIVNATICIGTILSYTAMAGYMGAGGLGSIAVQNGFQGFKPEIITVAVVLLVLIMQVFQFFGMWLSRKLDKRLRE